MDVLYVINPYVSTLRKRKELQTSKIIKLPYVVTFVVLLCTFVLWFHCEKYVPKQYCDFDKDMDKLYRKIFEKRVRNIIVTASSKQSVNVQFSVGHGRRIVDLCPEIPDGLRQNTTTDVASIANKDGVAPGGSWYPSDCVARHRVAVIVPYRDRRQHLEILLRSLIPTLQQQSIHFRIYVVEQHGLQTFNKGVLMNSGFVEALADETWDCFVFHDVDLVAETNLPMYTCPPNPRHLSVAIDEMKYKLKYDHLIGGVFIIRREHFLTINGYSNEYWGWGSEDDDLAKRYYSVTSIKG